MGRHEQPEIRQRLLEACTDHALAHGLPDRMQPLADASGTSVRMLIYHFGGRDPLLRLILAHARQRQVDLFTRLMAPVADTPYTETLADAWAAMTGPEGRPYVRMFGTVRPSSEQHLSPEFRRRATTDWLPLLELGLGTVGRPELATLLLAVIRGLLLDLDATGDTARTDRAFRQFLGTV